MEGVEVRPEFDIPMQEYTRVTLSCRPREVFPASFLYNRTRRINLNNKKYDDSFRRSDSRLL